MANLSPIASAGAAVGALSGVASAVGIIAVTPQQVIGYQPQPYNTLADNITSFNLPTILFHYEGEQSVALESDITDHFVEDNTALQDQIAQKPVIISTNGYLGELNDLAQNGLQTAKLIANKLVSISGYAPSLSVTALNAYNEALYIYQTASNAINAATSAVSSLSGSPNNQVSKQQSIFQQFYGYWNARFLFSVQTPWAVFPNCAIMSMRSVQDETTNVITDFNVTFKQLQFASTQTTSATQAVQGQLSAQLNANNPTNNGVTSPADNGTTPPGGSNPVSN